MRIYRAFLRFCFAGVLLTAALLTAAHAQPLAVEATEPAQGSVNVPLEDTVRIDFTTAVTVSTDWDGLFVAEPRTRIVRLGAALCIQQQGACAGGDEDVPRFVRLPVRHEADTDYTWFIEAVETPSGEVLAEPYTLHYTTAATIGQHVVQGTVVAAPAGKRSTAAGAAAARALRTAAQHLARSGMGQLPFMPAADVPSTATATGQARAGDGAEAPGHTRILLLSNFFTDAQLWTVQNGTTMRAATGPFEIPYVRTGRYWPLAVRYTDGTATVIEQLGYYDPDGDGEPDPIEVTAGDVTGLELVMYAFQPATALTRAEAAAALAAEVADDQVLKAIASVQQFFADGTAYTWAYTYYAPSLDLVTVVRIDPLGADTLTQPDFEGIAAWPTLDAGRIVDTDVALQRVLDDGGADFLEVFPVRRRQNEIATGFNARGELQWDVVLRGLTSSGAETFTRSVALYAGVIVSSEAAQPLPERSGLLSVYPNPFRDHATISYEIDGQAPVRLRVYDLLGRTVARLEARPAGQQAVQWDGRGSSGRPVPPGLYVVRLETSAGTYTRLVTRLR